MYMFFEFFFWTGFNILLVLSFITELNKFFDTFLSYICMSHDFTLLKNII